MNEKIKLAIILKSLELARKDGVIVDCIWVADSNIINETLYEFILSELGMEMDDRGDFDMEELEQIIKGGK